MKPGAGHSSNSRFSNSFSRVTGDVPGTSNMWLAGMPPGTPSPGGGSAPTQSPVQFTTFAVTPGLVVPFNPTGAGDRVNRNKLKDFLNCFPRTGVLEYYCRVPKSTKRLPLCVEGARRRKVVRVVPIGEGSAQRREASIYVRAETSISTHPGGGSFVRSVVAASAGHPCLAACVFLLRTR